MSSPLSSLPPSSPPHENDTTPTLEQIYPYPDSRPICDPVTPSHRARADLPPLELSPGFVLSSPVVGTAEERQAKRLEKGQKKRTRMLAEKAAEKELEESFEAEQKLAHDQESFRGCLDYLHSRGLTFGDLCMYYFNPDSDAGTVRWHEFAAVRGRITQLLDWWSHAKSLSVRLEVHDWAVNHVCVEIGKSARHITRLGLLRTHDELINKTFVSSFTFNKLHQHFSKEASIIVRVLEAITKSSDRSDSFGEARKARGQMVDCLLLISQLDC